MKHDLADDYSLAKWLRERKELNPSARLIGIALIFLGMIFVFWGLWEVNEIRIDEIIRERHALLLVEEIRGSEIITDEIKKRATTVARLSSRSDFDDSLLLGSLSAIFGFILISTGSRKLRAEPVGSGQPM